MMPLLRDPTAGAHAQRHLGLRAEDAHGQLVALISSEKMPTALPSSMATFCAMLTAKLVLWTQMSLATKLCVSGTVRS